MEFGPASVRYPDWGRFPVCRISIPWRASRQAQFHRVAGSHRMVPGAAGNDAVFSQPAWNAGALFAEAGSLLGTNLLWTLPFSFALLLLGLSHFENATPQPKRTPPSRRLERSNWNHDRFLRHNSCGPSVLSILRTPISSVQAAFHFHSFARLNFSLILCMQTNMIARQGVSIHFQSIPKNDKKHPGTLRPSGATIAINRDSRDVIFACIIRCRSRGTLGHIEFPRRLGRG